MYTLKHVYLLHLLENYVYHNVEHQRAFIVCLFATQIMRRFVLYFVLTVVFEVFVATFCQQVVEPVGEVEHSKQKRKYKSKHD